MVAGCGTWFSYISVLAGCVLRHHACVQIINVLIKSSINHLCLAYSGRAGLLDSTDSPIVRCLIVSLIVRILNWVLFFFFGSLCLSCARRETLLQSLLFQDPIVFEIEIEIFSHEKLPEHLYTILVIWFLVKLQFPTIVEELAELFGVARS